MQEYEIINPTPELEKTITELYPILYYHWYGDTTIIITCKTATEDPYTKDWLLTISDEFIRIMLFIKAGSCERVRKWKL